SPRLLPDEDSAMRLTALLLLLLATAAALAADDLQGRWRPDVDANNVLSQTEGAASPAGESRPGRGGGMRGKGGGMGGGGMGHRGGRGRGADGAASPNGDTREKDLDTHESLQERFVPRAADLLLHRAGDDVTIGVDGDPLQLHIGGDPVALPDRDAKVSLARSGDDLVLAIDGPRGMKRTVTYRLEGDGKRLRVLTSIQLPNAQKPIERQRLYRRGDAAEPAPTPAG
ncbi:MAG TPA: hypothetical protein VF471_09545, partial [Pseudoxanthomonas sp.]